MRRERNNGPRGGWRVLNPASFLLLIFFSLLYFLTASQSQRNNKKMDRQQQSVSLADQRLIESRGCTHSLPIQSIESSGYYLRMPGSLLYDSSAVESLFNSILSNRTELILSVRKCGFTVQPPRDDDVVAGDLRGIPGLMLLFLLTAHTSTCKHDMLSPDVLYRRCIEVVQICYSDPGKYLLPSLDRCG